MQAPQHFAGLDRGGEVLAGEPLTVDAGLVVGRVGDDLADSAVVVGRRVDAD